VSDAGFEQDAAGDDLAPALRVRDLLRCHRIALDFGLPAAQRALARLERDAGPMHRAHAEAGADHDPGTARSA